MRQHGHILNQHQQIHQNHSWKSSITSPSQKWDSFPISYSTKARSFCRLDEDMAIGSGRSPQAIAPPSLKVSTTWVAKGPKDSEAKELHKPFRHFLRFAVGGWNKTDKYSPNDNFNGDSTMVVTNKNISKSLLIFWNTSSASKVQVLRWWSCVKKLWLSGNHRRCLVGHWSFQSLLSCFLQ